MMLVGSVVVWYVTFRLYCVRRRYWRRAAIVASIATAALAMLVS